MSKSISEVVAELPVSPAKGTTKPQNTPSKPRSEKKRPEVAATPPKAGKGQKNTKESKPAPKAKKVKVPASITAATGSALSHVDPRKNTTITTHRAQLGFKSTGNSYSISSILRWLGFHCGSGQAAAVAWLRYCGFSETTAACAGQQTSSGKNTAQDKKGNPAAPGRHGSVPKLKPEEVKELKALFAAANPAAE